MFKYSTFSESRACVQPAPSRVNGGVLFQLHPEPRHSSQPAFKASGPCDQTNPAPSVSQRWSSRPKFNNCFQIPGGNYSPTCKAGVRRGPAGLLRAISTVTIAKLLRRASTESTFPVRPNQERSATDYCYNFCSFVIFKCSL